MPAPASSPIAAVADQVGRPEVLDPVVVAPTVVQALAGVVDPRARRGVRHRLVVVLTAAVCAVAAGARSFVAISEWIADVPDEVAVALGLNHRCPSESTIRRILGRIDAEVFDAVISTFLQCLSVGRPPVGRCRVVAVDGKTLRGSRSAEVSARHLFAAVDHHHRVVLGQVEATITAGHSGEIAAFTPLLDTLTELDLAGVVVTADALHTQTRSCR